MAHDENVLQIDTSIKSQLSFMNPPFVPRLQAVTSTSTVDTTSCLNY